MATIETGKNRGLRHFPHLRIAGELLPAGIPTANIGIDTLYISYSTKDEDFAERLHSRLLDAKVRVWFAPEDFKGGEKLYDQIEWAIQIHETSRLRLTWLFNKYLFLVTRRSGKKRRPSLTTDKEFLCLRKFPQPV